MASLARSIRVVAAGLLAALGGACSQPTGVVISVEGAEGARQLWLTVGEVMKDGGGKRFLRTDETGFIEHTPPFDDGFEIFLDRDELMGQGEIALVLDSAVPAAPVDILRDSYVLTPESGSLTEVKLTPKEIGPGKWVCAGRSPSSAGQGFAVVLGPSEEDCDRDGWKVANDPDDADPLKVRAVEWRMDLLPGRCALGLGGNRPYPRFLPTFSCSCQSSPIDDSAFDGCVAEEERIHCEISEKRQTLAVKTVFRGMALGNPDWELIRLGPDGVSAYFAPSFKALDEWSVTFDLGGSQFGWFVLTDRTEDGVSKVIRVAFKENGANECVSP